MSYDLNKFNGLKAGAETFNSAYKILDIMQTIPQIQEINHAPFFLISKIVNQALFCEIGLKALIIQDGNNYNRIHKLGDLFKALHPNTQQTIIEKTTIEKDIFDNLLMDNNDHFTKWRYFFEGNVQCNPEFMDKFSAAILSVLHDKERA